MTTLVTQNGNGKNISVHFLNHNFWQ